MNFFLFSDFTRNMHTNTLFQHGQTMFVFIYCMENVIIDHITHVLHSLQFSYSTQAPNITAAFAVIWDVNKPFDNPENIHGKLCFI